MSYELITEAEYDNLPEDDQLRFVAFEAICRRRMTEIIAEAGNDDAIDFVRLQYMAEVSGAAEALGIEEIGYPSHLSRPEDFIGEFMLNACRVGAKFRLSSRATSQALSVRLAENTRGLIEKQIQNLRSIIIKGDIEEDKRKKLLRRLEELSMELSQPRISFAKVMSVIAHISMGVTVGTTFLADAPHALATISALLGHDKIKEEAEIKRLGAPPKAIAGPSKQNKPVTPQPLGRMRDIVDEDIPF